MTYKSNYIELECERTFKGDPAVTSWGVGQKPERDRHGRWRPTGPRTVFVTTHYKTTPRVMPQTIYGLPVEYDTMEVDLYGSPGPQVTHYVGDSCPGGHRESGAVSALDATSRHRPVIGGVSVGQRDITAGTLGGVVYRDGTPCFLSNAHVFRLPTSDESVTGLEVVQPGPIDGGEVPDDVIGHVITNELVGKADDADLILDVALATPAVEFVPDLWVHGERIEQKEGQRPQIGAPVKTVGRPNELPVLKTGEVVFRDVTVQVNWWDGTLRTFHCHVVYGHGTATKAPPAGFSEPGNSGSLVWYREDERLPVDPALINVPVGVIFAGANGGQHDGATFIVCAAELCEALNVSFLPPADPPEQTRYAATSVAKTYVGVAPEPEPDPELEDVLLDVIFPETWPSELDVAVFRLGDMVPLVDARVVLSVDGVDRVSALTDADGTVLFAVPSVDTTLDHELVVRFPEQSLP